MARVSTRHIEPLLPSGVAVNPKTETLVDSFTTSIDLAKWDLGAGGTTDISSGQLRGTVLAASTGYAGVSSDGRYDLTNSYIMVKATLGLRSGSHEYHFEFVKNGDANNKLTFYSSGTAFAARNKVDNVDSDTSLTYDSTAHQWWRIREGTGAGAGGTPGTIYWDTSADGLTWTNRKTATAPAWVNNGYVNILAGQYSTQPADTVGLYDNFNVIPALAVSATFSLPYEAPTGARLTDVDVLESTTAAQATSALPYEVRTGAIAVSATFSLPLEALVAVRQTDTEPIESQGQLTAYPTLIMAHANLIDYWRLGDSGTTAVDIKNARNGTYTSGYTHSTGFLPSDGAVTFDGTSGYVDLPSTVPSLAGSALTIEAWIKPDFSKTIAMIFGAYADTPYPGYGFIFGHPTAAAIAYYDSTAAVWRGSTSDVPNDGDYHHVVATVSSTGTIKLYIDKTLVGTFAGSTPGSHAGVKAIGTTAYSPKANFYKGIIDEVALYNAELSLTEISNHYDTGRAEQAGAVSVSATFSLPLEASTAPRATVSTNIESQLAVRATAAANLDTSAQLTATTISANVEVLSGARTTAVAALETTVVITSSSAASYEALPPSLSVALSGVYETLLKLTVTSTVNLEANPPPLTVTAAGIIDVTTGVRATPAAAAYTALIGVRSTADGFLESAGGVRITQTFDLGLDVLGALRVTLTESYETQLPVSATRSANIEALLGLTQSISEPFDTEGRTAVSQSLVLPYEAFSRLAATALQIPYDTQRGGIVNSVLGQIDVLKGTTSTQSAQIEIYVIFAVSIDLGYETIAAPQIYTFELPYEIAAGRDLPSRWADIVVEIRPIYQAHYHWAKPFVHTEADARSTLDVRAYVLTGSEEDT